jgi:hypothetical protein
MIDSLTPLTPRVNGLRTRAILPKNMTDDCLFVIEKVDEYRKRSWDNRRHAVVRKRLQGEEEKMSQKYSQHLLVSSLLPHRYYGIMET